MIQRQIMAWLVSVIFLSMFAAGCSLASESSAEPGMPTLENTLWQLTRIVSRDTPTGPDSIATELIGQWEHITAYFVDGEVGGSTGCNHYGASYQINDTQLTLTKELVSTAALCSDERGNRRERAFLAGLEAATSYAIADHQLTIAHPDGELIFQAQPDQAGNEIAVYAELLRGWQGGQEQLVILNEIRTGAPGSDIDETGNVVQQQFGSILPLWENFRAKNSAPQVITGTLDIGFPTTFISTAEVEALFANGEQAGWPAFRQRYPGAQRIFSLSRVGFNAAGDEALVYLGIRSEQDTGGFYNRLTLHYGIWKTAQGTRIWEE
jgi:heat shock protein HslJ